MRKLLIGLVALILVLLPIKTFAAGGITASGGGTKTAGSNFSITVTASGTSFNAVEGTISVSGPISIVSFGAGGAIWMTAPGNGVHFVGMLTSATSSLRVATITLKGTKPGSGSVSVSNVRLALSGSSVGTGASGTSFTITRAPTPPGTVQISSTTHPDPAQQYEATAAIINWGNPENGATGYSYVWDKVADTNPANTVNTTGTTVTLDKLAIGTYYFHIKGQNGDGWGSPSHFQVNIKEPENLINKKLTKPKNIIIGKSSKFKNNLKDGTVTGLVIKGNIPTKSQMDKFVTLADTATIDDPVLKAKSEIYQANIILTPEIKLPQGKSLSLKPSKNGDFRLLIDYPIPAGPYKLTIQGQRAKTLTPASSEIMFEISQAKGGILNILSKDDANTPAPVKPKIITPFRVAMAEGVIIILIIIFWIITKINGKRKNRFPKETKKDNRKDDGKKDNDILSEKDEKKDKNNNKKEFFNWDMN